jgi:hypothetical protein
VVVVLALLALAATSGIASPGVRVVALLLFLVFGPGLGLVGLLGIADPWREVALVIGVSLALDLVVVAILAYAGAPSSGIALAVLIGIAVLGSAAQTAMAAVRRRTEQVAP